LDTSVLVSLEASARPASDAWVSTLSLAELAAGPAAATSPAERGRREQRLQVVEAGYGPLAFDAACARAYAQVYSAMALSGRKARGRHAVDLLIAATAMANDLPLYTLNADDLRGLEGVLRIVDCS
jgi:predicted nucleic acid-binding protein